LELDRQGLRAPHQNVEGDGQPLGRAGREPERRRRARRQRAARPDGRGRRPQSADRQDGPELPDGDRVNRLIGDLDAELKRRPVLDRAPIAGGG
jgi:hypothetical protein